MRFQLFRVHLSASLKCLCFIVLSHLSLPSLATVTLDSLNSTTLKTLAYHPQWLNLLHYSPKGRETLQEKKTPLTGMFSARATSFVDDEDFFLSANGDKDPLAELTQTLAALFRDNTIQCRFPARTMWLKQQLPKLAEQLKPNNCPKYQQWRDYVNADEFVLVFAASYLNSPSSMYGHTFFRIDPPNMEQSGTLLSYALGFGATVSEEDNSILYAYRGIFGGYPGTFDSKSYYEKVKEYSRMENRDLWEYHLNLDKPEIDLLMAHFWELNFIHFDYYFLDENCSLRLLELLDIVKPELQLSGQFTDITIPADTVRVVADAGLIKKVHYRPSNQIKLKALINNLSKQEQALALGLSKNHALLAQQPFLTLSTEKQQRVALLAYRYLRYQINKQARDASNSERSLALLRFINQSATQTPDIVIKRPIQPELGHKSKRNTLNLGNSNDEFYADIAFHLGYHDLLDRLDGFPNNASLNMGRLDVRFQEGESPQLQRAELLDIQSLSPRNRFFKPLSWQVNMGLERISYRHSEPLVAQINGGVGYSYSVGKQVDIYGLATLRVENNETFTQNTDIASGLTIGSLWGNQQHRFQISASHQDFLAGETRQAIQASYNWAFTVNKALRFSVNRQVNASQGVSEAHVSYRHYF